MDEDQKPNVIEPRAEWPTPQKNRVKALFNDAEWSKHAISKELQIPRSTVQRLLRSNNARRDGRKRSGRAKKLSVAEVDKLVSLATEHEWKGQTYT